MVITVLTLVVVGNQLSPSVIFLGVSPIDAVIVLVWLVGIYMIGKARTDLPWHKLIKLLDSQEEEMGHSKKKKYDSAIKKGVLFGATVLAAATALPEVSTGLAAMKLKDYQMAISDIFGGNAFLPVLFMVATVLSGKPVLPQAHKTDIYLTGLGILLTIIYIFGLMFRPRKQLFWMGVDSFLVLIVYLVGLLGLFAIS